MAPAGHKKARSRTPKPTGRRRSSERRSKTPKTRSRRRSSHSASTSKKTRAAKKSPRRPKSNGAEASATVVRMKSRFEMCERSRRKRMKAGKKKREANEAATAAMLREGMENAAALALTMVNDVTAEGAMQKIKEMKTAIAKEAANMAKEAEEAGRRFLN